jgi:His-Xaa-Ser system radical SAM maturase HxsC
MITLWGRSAHVSFTRPRRRTVWLVEGANTFIATRRARAYLVEQEEDDRTVPSGFSLYITRAGRRLSDPTLPAIELPAVLDHLQPGDILSVSRDGTRLRVKWRPDSAQNSVLLTERCDNYCLMCSQPPKRADDEWLLDEAFELVRLLSPETRQIILTGGEPTLYGKRFIDLLTLCREQIPDTGLHILSNGRRFADHDFARAYAAVENRNMMVGIPVYGSEPSLHDYVVQAEGAFDDTIRGILNLAQLRQRIEIRVVIHKQTAPALVEIAEFIARNLPFVEQVALMGLEMIGFARANLDAVWIDPIDYREQLSEAATLLDRKGIRTLIYNHQLCLIERKAWPYAVKSISDWKNEYHDECQDCSVLEACGGFFSSATYRMSDHIRAIPPEESPFREPEPGQLGSALAST